MQRDLLKLQTFIFELQFSQCHTNCSIANKLVHLLQQLWYKVDIQKKNNSYLKVLKLSARFLVTQYKWKTFHIKHQVREKVHDLMFY